MAKLIKSIFSKILKKEKSPYADFKPELREGWEAYEKQNFEKAGSISQKFISSPDSSLAKEAKKLKALTEFQQNNYSGAYPLFLEISDSSKDVNDWFNVVTSAALAGEIKISENAFEKVIQIHQETEFKQTPTLPVIRQYYACALRDMKEYSKAFEQIEELRKVYEQLKITDDTFVYMRGVPFLSHTMNVAIDIFQGMGEKSKGKKWIQSFSKNIDDDGKKYLMSIMDKLD